MTDLSELIERVESGDEPDYFLHEEIALAVGGYSVFQSKHGYWRFRSPDGQETTADGRYGDYDPQTGEKLPEEIAPSGWGDVLHVPEYTSSLDAVLSLIEAKLPGWYWGAEKMEPQSFEANVFDGRRAADRLHSAYSSSPARALLAAALRALQESRSHDR